uniref:Uncharacterized protein n=1 Tax=Octopus bimaculoides TaxID=37653 RepID=A0A0L8G3S2_OCTBM
MSFYISLFLSIFFIYTLLCFYIYIFIYPCIFLTFIYFIFLYLNIPNVLIYVLDNSITLNPYMYTPIIVYLS